MPACFADVSHVCHKDTKLGAIAKLQTSVTVALPRSSRSRTLSLVPNTVAMLFMGEGGWSWSGVVCEHDAVCARLHAAAEDLQGECV
jgi:hypothetical protein